MMVALEDIHRLQSAYNRHIGKCELCGKEYIRNYEHISKDIYVCYNCRHNLDEQFSKS